MKKSIKSILAATVAALLTVVFLVCCTDAPTVVADPEVSVTTISGVVTLVETSVSPLGGTSNSTTVITTSESADVTTCVETIATTITQETEEFLETVELKMTETPKVEETEIVTTEPEVIVTEVEITTQEIIETQPPVIEPEYVVYKASTHYIHRSTCHWSKSGDPVRIENTDGIEARKCSECNPEMDIVIEYVEPEKVNTLNYYGYFGRVTYYPATAYYSGVCGGSGRTLLGYGNYDNGIRGSVASRSLYEAYGYNYNGRTTVYLEFPGYESMNGYYYVDDCCANYGVIDVFVWDSYSCPFYNAGVITANCYI